MRWLVPAVDPDAIANLSRELGFAPLLARLLVRRGIRDPETAQRFLRPSLDQIPHPFLMAGMPVAHESFTRGGDADRKEVTYGGDGAGASPALLVRGRPPRAIRGKVPGPNT